jgi:hypothetical protein
MKHGGAKNRGYDRVLQEPAKTSNAIIAVDDEEPDRRELAKRTSLHEL